MWMGQIPLRKDRDFLIGLFRKKNPVMLMRHGPKTKWQGKPETRQMEKEKLANAEIKEVKKNTHQTT